MPTYNRRATIGRAIDSVKAQTFPDWELIIVDDGSTDGTAEAIAGIDPRVKVLKRPNGGISAARNDGVRASRGQFLAFLDSDDAWSPHFLALTYAYLEHHPDVACVATEFLEQRGAGAMVRQDETILKYSYAPLARRLGSTKLDLPPGETDDYLRVYTHKERLGDWARSILPADRDPADLPWAYSGRIGAQFRWGYLLAMWCVLLRRDAALAAGPFPEHRRNCSDFGVLARLARDHEIHMIAEPCMIKHEVSGNAAAHLASGAGHLRFNRSLTEQFEEMFLQPDPTNRELLDLRAFRHLATAKAAFGIGDLDAARTHLDIAAERLMHWTEVKYLLAVLALAGNPATVRKLYFFGEDVARQFQRVSLRTQRLFGRA